MLLKVSLLKNMRREVSFFGINFERSVPLFNKECIYTDRNLQVGSSSYFILWVGEGVIL